MATEVRNHLLVTEQFQESNFPSSSQRQFVSYFVRVHLRLRLCGVASFWNEARRQGTLQGLVTVETAETASSLTEADLPWEDCEGPGGNRKRTTMTFDSAHWPWMTLATSDVVKTCTLGSSGLRFRLSCRRNTRTMRGGSFNRKGGCGSLMGSVRAVHGKYC